MKQFYSKDNLLSFPDPNSNPMWISLGVEFDKHQRKSKLKYTQSRLGEEDNIGMSQERDNLYSESVLSN